ncbi:hypothetical protein [Nocardiopsis halophila]|uniref:hypothetical protein n=1 Tax=Nocardiopsis halophila TaxID=141692 RepID=UPI0003483635|nr:hypothetical protein [Nocardiopsis halophila]
MAAGVPDQIPRPDPESGAPAVPPDDRCGLPRPGQEERRPLPCLLAYGHDGPHQDARGHTWRDTQAHADMLYDLLSESLKARPRTWRELRGALEASDRALDDLDRWIKDGGPLPGPWRRADPR